jgi:hypothetical protein
VGGLVTKRLANISRYLSRHDSVAVKISRRVETLPEGEEEEDWDPVPRPVKEDPESATAAVPPDKEDWQAAVDLLPAVGGIKEEEIDIDEREMNLSDTLSAPEEEDLKLELPPGESRLCSLEEVFVVFVEE